MAKIARVLQKIFGATGGTGEFGKFGSEALGTPETTKDLSEIQSLAPYDQGLYAATENADEPPRIQDINGLYLLFSSQLAYLHQAGISEWNAATEYFDGDSVVIGSDGGIYMAIQGTDIAPNLNQNPTTATTWWRLIIDKTGKSVNTGLVDGTTPGAGGKLLLALSALSSLSPGMAGTAAAGSSNIPSRQDHIHPTDTSRTPTSRTISAGVGLSGGGDLSANRTVSMGTPSTVTPSSTNSASGTTHNHALDVAALLLAVYPIGSYYTQYPDASSNTDATEFPTTQRPATLFGGTWAEQWATESIYFRTRGTLSDSGRTNGLQQDAFQGHQHNWAIGYSGSQVIDSVGASFNSLQTNKAEFIAKTKNTIADTLGNGTPRIDTETRTVNRRIKVWKRTA